MPKPKLISFAKKPVFDTTNSDVAVTKNETPFNKNPKKPTKFVPPPAKNVEVVEPESEPEDEDENERSVEPSYVEPEPVVPQKPKKQISERQRLHLENMRKRKHDKINKPLQPKPAAPSQPAQPVAPSAQPTQPRESDDDKEFSKWLSNFEKFNTVMSAREKKKLEAEEKERLKEEAMESRIRQKINDERDQRQGIKPKPATQAINSSAILEHNNNPYPEYGKYFGYK